MLGIKHGETGGVLAAYSLVSNAAGRSQTPGEQWINKLKWVSNSSSCNKGNKTGAWSKGRWDPFCGVVKKAKITVSAYRAGAGCQTLSWGLHVSIHLISTTVPWGRHCDLSSLFKWGNQGMERGWVRTKVCTVTGLSGIWTQAVFTLLEWCYTEGNFSIMWGCWDRRKIPSLFLGFEPRSSPLPAVGAQHSRTMITM